MIGDGEPRSRHVDPLPHYEGGHSNQEDLLHKLERVLSSTGKKTRFAPVLDVSNLSMSGSSMHASRELVYHEPPSTGRRYSSTSVWEKEGRTLTETQYFQLAVLLERETNARHALEHIRCVELQLMTLVVTQAHRNDALSHLHLQTKDNLTLRKELATSRSNLVNINMSNNPTDAGGVTMGVPNDDAAGRAKERSLVSAGLKMMRRELGMSQQREFGLAWMVVSQQEQYLRGQITLQEESLWEVTAERFRCSIVQMECAEREQQDAKGDMEVQTRQWMMQAHAHTLQQSHQQQEDMLTLKQSSSELCADLFKDSSEALLRAEHAKQIELLESELTLNRARHAAELNEKEASVLRLVKEIHAVKAGTHSHDVMYSAMSESYTYEKQRTAEAEESAARAVISEREMISRNAIGTASVRAEQAVLYEQGHLMVSKARLETTQLEAKLLATQREFQTRLHAAETRAEAAEESVASRILEAKSETKMLKEYVSDKEASHERAMRAQEAELTVHRLQYLSSLTSVGSLESAVRGELCADERQDRHRVHSDMRVALFSAEKDRAVILLKVAEGKLHNAQKHAEARDHMNASLRQRIADLEDTMHTKLESLRAEYNDVSDTNSTLRMEKGRMVNKIAMAEAKADWASARKTMISDSEGDIVEGLRREVVQLHADLEQALYKPQTSTANFQIEVTTHDASWQVEQDLRVAMQQTDEVSVFAKECQTMQIIETPSERPLSPPDHPPPAPPTPPPLAVLRVELVAKEWSCLHPRAVQRELEVQRGDVSPRVPKREQVAEKVVVALPAPVELVHHKVPVVRQKSTLGGAGSYHAHLGLPWYRTYQERVSQGYLQLGSGQRLPEILGEDLDWVDGKRVLVFDTNQDLGMVFNSRIRNRIETVHRGSQAARKGLMRGMTVTKVGSNDILYGDETLSHFELPLRMVPAVFDRTALAESSGSGSPPPPSLIDSHNPTRRHRRQMESTSSDSESDEIDVRQLRVGGGGGGGRNSRSPSAASFDSRTTSPPPAPPQIPQKRPEKKPVVSSVDEKKIRGGAGGGRGGGGGGGGGGTKPRGRSLVRPTGPPPPPPMPDTPVQDSIVSVVSSDGGGVDTPPPKPLLRKSSFDDSDE